jgi:predicted HD phosphohydrolase
VLYTADAYRKDGKRFTVIADDKLTAFLELERATLETDEKSQRASPLLRVKQLHLGAFETAPVSIRLPVRRQVPAQRLSTEGADCVFRNESKMTMTADEYEKLPAAERKHFRRCPDCRGAFDLRRFDDVVLHLARHNPKQSVFRIRDPERLE